MRQTFQINRTGMSIPLKLQFELFTEIINKTDHRKKAKLVMDSTIYVDWAKRTTPLKCSCCEKTDWNVRFVICPYDADVNGKDTWKNYCQVCYVEAEMGI